MTRNRLLVIGALAAAGLVAGVLLVFLGGSSNPTVAHVGAETIRRDQLELAVEHFRREAKAEGTPFPGREQRPLPGRAQPGPRRPRLPRRAGPGRAAPRHPA